MHAALHQSRTATDVTLILFTPRNDFHLPIRRFAHGLARSIARLKYRSIMFRIVSWRSRKRDPHATRMQEVPMRTFASPIHKPMLLQIRNELPNFARHIKLASKKQPQRNAKVAKRHRDRERPISQVAATTALQSVTSVASGRLTLSQSVRRCNDVTRFNESREVKPHSC